MQHLDTERLAALADEPPTAEEVAHLGHCLVCRRERDVYVALLDLAQRSGSAELDAPISSWDAIAAGLRADAAEATTAEMAPATVRPITPVTPFAAPARRTARTTWFLRAAASVAIMTGSVAVGRISAGAAALPSVAELRETVGARGVTLASNETGEAEAGGIASFVTNPVADTVTPNFASVAEAAMVLARSQREYLRAAAFLAAHDSTRPPTGDHEAYRARLAALDEMMPTLRAALYEAPQDPVLNQYYLAAYDTRENTLRELGRALPAGVTLNRY